MKGRDARGRFLPGPEHPMKTEELRKKSSESHKGCITWNKGKKGLQHHSQQTRSKMSLAALGKNTWSKERPSKLKGIPLAEYHVCKLRISRRHRVIPKNDTKPERMMALALTLHGITFEKHKALVGQPDIFIEPNICIFVDGDFWHANPAKYKAEQYIIHGRLAKDIWAKDIRINHELTKLGYIIIRLWESDILQNVNNCAEKIIELTKQVFLGGKLRLHMPK